MENSWQTILTTLKRAKIVLEEVLTVMPESSSSKHDISNTHKAVDDLIKNSNQELQKASAQLEYKKLIQKLKTQNLSFREDEW